MCPVSRNRNRYRIARLEAFSGRACIPLKNTFVAQRSEATKATSWKKYLTVAGALVPLGKKLLRCLLLSRRSKRSFFVNARHRLLVTAILLLLTALMRTRPKSTDKEVTVSFMAGVLARLKIVLQSNTHVSSMNLVNVSEPFTIADFSAACVA